MKCLLPSNLDKKSSKMRKNSYDFNQISLFAAGKIHHHWHFVLTLLTLGGWGIVWWRLIRKTRGLSMPFFEGFDDAYWSYLIEREQPPAALYNMSFDAIHRSVIFEA